MKAYAIADARMFPAENEFLDRIELLSSLGVERIQLRAKHLDDADLLGLAERCRARIGHGTRFIVNGRCDVAAAVGADGVHLPAEGVPVSLVRAITPELEIGRSCHSVDDVAAAAGEGADLVLLGPVHAARSEAKDPRVTTDDLRGAVAPGVAVYALGGFDRERSLGLEGTGVEGVAGITMFMTDEPIAEILSAIRGVRS